MKTLTKNGVLLVIVAVLLIVPLLQNVGEFGSSDDQGRQAITAIDPAYRAWFSPLWQPPGKEIESLLFALQAALGAGVIGYCFGYWRGRRSATRES